jgi:hypothetical protein
MALRVASTDCELISAVVEPGSPDTRLSQPDRAGTLVAISFLRLYSKEVIGLSPGPLAWRCGDALERQGNKPEYNSEIKHTLTLSQH